MSNNMNQSRIATKGDWRTQEFKDLVPLPYVAKFDAEEFERLKRGLIPDVMEDKWFIYFSDNTLFIHRSWTGAGVYQVQLMTDDDGVSVKRAFVSTELETAREHLDHNARVLGWLISRFLLGRNEPYPHS